MRKNVLLAAGALALSGTSAWALGPKLIDGVQPLGQMQGQVTTGEAVVLYDNVPGAGETVFSTTSTPRTGGADEAMITGPAALVTSMQFGFLVGAGGPAAFDARVRFWDDINFAAGAGTPQFGNIKADFTVSFTNQVAGAFITSPIDLTGLPGGGVSVTSNPANLGVANITDTYVQLDFLQPGTTTPVAGNLVTYIFDGSGVNVGDTFASPILGGDGTAASEVYWRDVSADGIITGDEARAFAAPNRSNFVLHLEGEVIPEPASLGLLGLSCLGLVRRRSR